MNTYSIAWTQLGKLYNKIVKADSEIFALKNVFNITIIEDTVNEMRLSLNHFEIEFIITQIQLE